MHCTAFLIHFFVSGWIHQFNINLIAVGYHSQARIINFYNCTSSVIEILNARCEISPNVERTIVSQLQHLFHENNKLVLLFKTAVDLMPTGTHKIVIFADKMPPGQHVGIYNAPTIDELAIVMVGDQFLPRDVLLRKQNAQLVRIAETHRCYDALQYPIIFWDGADGYHFNNKLQDPSTNKQTDCNALLFLQTSDLAG